MRNFTVMIVEDDSVACAKFIDYLSTFEDVDLVSLTNNSSKAVSDIRLLSPDAVILDLELHNGGGSGLDVLSQIKDYDPNCIPYFLVTTNNTSSITYDYARQLGADYIMFKHQENYSVEKAFDFLYSLKDTIQRSKKTINSPSINVLTNEEKSKNLRRLICVELNNVGINPKFIGYQYLIDAIEIIADKNTPNISSIIGKKYGKTESSVERAMQNAITSAWNHRDIDDLYRFYTAKIHSEKGTPTVTEFIYYYALKIKI